MKTRYFINFAIAIFVFLAGFLSMEKHERAEESSVEEGHAADAFEYWYNQRAYPYGIIPKQKYLDAVHYVQTTMLKEENVKNKLASDTSRWISIGPDNVGGRVLAITVSPSNSSIVWAGSASGGLWKSINGGFGPDAWTYVNTGYPTMAVGSIAIDPIHPDTMFIGTGEAGGGYKFNQIGTPGARTTYGMGILKSMDGGITWSLTGLVWSFSQITAVQKIVINPQNPNTVFAATTEGTYKSTDGGSTWIKVHSVLMAMDIVINPVDTTVLYAAYGQSNTTLNSGIYETTDAGISWNLLTTGLPNGSIGRTSLSICHSNPQILYAGISNPESHAILGLYKTSNAGANWSLMSTTNYVGNQGWYDNVIAVSPTNPDTVYCAGLDIYRSINGGSTLSRKSYWTAFVTGVVPNGGPEGTIVYSHADHHAITVDPADSKRIYFGNDGGVFFSGDGGATFRGCNGGFTTTQFYNGFANALSDSLIALGGLQDNGSVKYEGEKSWNKVVSGDGGWCAVDPIDPTNLYEEYVYLAISKSTSGGEGWFPSTNGLSTGPNNANFIAPFVSCPTDPYILYAGAKTVFVTYGAGDYWFPPSGTEAFNGTSVSCIGVSSTSSDTLMAGTGGSVSNGSFPQFQIFASTTGGYMWDNVTGSLPARYPTDISFDPNSSFIAYLTYSGYGSSHVFKTTDIGKSWVDISSNLPDIPVQSVVVDPAYPSNIYVGTDLGVFRTLDGGGSWHEYNNGMPPAMVLDLGISKINRVLRAATFGNGVYERQLLSVPATVSVSYHKQWNMLSIPMAVPDSRKNVLFPASSSFAYSYDNGYAVQETLKNGIGYFLRFSSPQSVTFSGSPIYRDTIQVRKGWNLIGSIADSIAVSEITSIPPGIADTTYYGFEGGYQLSSSLLPGKGYWVKAKQSGALVLVSSGGSKRSKSDQVTKSLLKGFHSLVIEDASGNRQQLYFGELTDRALSQESYEMPPVPPSGIFDVRFTTHQLVALHDHELTHSLDIPIHIQSASYPLTISWKISGGNAVRYELTDAASGKYFSPVSMDEEGRTEITNSTVTVLHLRVSNANASVAKVFRLEQNYPNPFNPSTTIKYQLPEKSRVKIEVFDVAGREIRTLVDGERNGGVWETDWDGKNDAGADVSSSIYYCRLSVFGIQEHPLVRVKKMLLVR